MINQRLGALSRGLVPVLALMLSLLSCRLYKLERRLDPQNEEFLSEVRYIITPEERKIFLELPDSEKENFKEEFWRRRDPDPETEENEFKLEYFSRIQRANEIFPSEGRPGWLTDRGRIYVLFGPPMDRITNAAFETEEQCSEVWYYGNFPVVFVDKYCRGEFVLITYNLTEMRDRNLAYMHDLNKAQMIMQETFSKEKPLFDFDWRLKKTSVTPSRVEAVIHLEFPYANLELEPSPDRLETQLEVLIELKDAEGNTVWKHQDLLSVTVTEQQLKEKRNLRYKKDIPLVLERELERLGRGSDTLHIRVKNRTGGQELQKVMDFKIY
jgi:GWxTD domain-containing protein